MRQGTKLAIVLITGLAAQVSASTVSELRLYELVPTQYHHQRDQLSPVPSSHSGRLPIQPKGEAYVAVREELHGQKVRVPGFVTPLETDSLNITSFLLVPYMGACVHAPPPPMNQMIFVEYGPGVSYQVAQGPVWIEGKLIVSGRQMDQIQIGYSMQATEIYAFE